MVGVTRFFGRDVGSGQHAHCNTDFGGSVQVLSKGKGIMALDFFSDRWEEGSTKLILRDANMRAHTWGGNFDRLLASVYADDYNSSESECSSQATIMPRQSPRFR